MTDTIETVDSTNDAEGQPVIVDPNLTGEDKVKAVETALAATTEKNKKLFARAKKAEGFEQDAAGKWVKKTKPTETVIIKPNETQATKPMDVLQSDEFQLHSEGYSPKEIQRIMEAGGKKILEDKTDPITIGVTTSKTQRIAEANASGTRNTGGQSEVEKRYTPEQMRAMKPDELKKIIGVAPPK